MILIAAPYPNTNIVGIKVIFPRVKAREDKISLRFFLFGTNVCDSSERKFFKAAN